MEECRGQGFAAVNAQWELLDPDKHMWHQVHASGNSDTGVSRCNESSRNDKKYMHALRLELLAFEGDLRLSVGYFDEAEHEVVGLVRGTAVEVAGVVGCRSTAWPYLGPGWARSRTWRVGGGPGVEEVL